MTLTTTLIEKARYGGKSHLGKTGKKAWSKHVIRDEVVAGLGLRVFPSERKTFVLSYREQGKRRTKTLGEFGSLTLEAAREQATKFLEAVGEPLSPPTAVATTVAGKIVTVADLTQAYLDQQLKKGGAATLGQQRLIRLHINPVLGRTPLSQVRSADLWRLRTQLAKRYPSDAARLSHFVRTMFKWASVQGLWQGGSQADVSEESSRAPRHSSSNDVTVSATPAIEEAMLVEEEAPEGPDGSGDSEGSEQAHPQPEFDEGEVEDSAEGKMSRSEIWAELMRTRHELDGVRRFGETDKLELREKIGDAEQRAGTLSLSVQQLQDVLRETEDNNLTLSRQLNETSQREEYLEGEIATLRDAVGAQDAELKRVRTSLESPLRAAAEPAPAVELPSRRTNFLSLVLSLVLGAILGALLVIVFWQVPEDSSGQGQVEGVRQPALTEAKTAAFETNTAELDVLSTVGSEPTETVAGEPTIVEADVLGRSHSADSGGEDDREIDLPVSEVSGTEVATDLVRAPLETLGATEPDFAPASLEETIQAWATAWSEQNVDGYLAFYSVHFDPEGSVNRNDWEARRRSRILRPSWIRLTVGPITASRIEEGLVTATFLQTYTTETYSDQVKKTLILAREQGGWKIVHERSG